MAKSIDEHESSRKHPPCINYLVEVKTRLLTFWWVYLAVFLGALLIICSALFLTTRTGIPLNYVLIDVVELSRPRLPVYAGLVSQLGGMAWGATAACCFLGTFLLWEDQRKRWFFLSSGLFVGWLGLDDMFLFHERVLPYLLHFKELWIFYIYALLLAVYLVYFARDILSDTEYPFLAIALVFSVYQ